VANWYVRPDGSDSNAGTGNTTATACATLNGVLAKAVAAGDSVFVAPGTYRQLVTMTQSGTSGSVISITADVDASHFDGTMGPGDVILTGYTTNDTTTPPSTSATIDLAGKSYLTLDGFLVVASANGASACIKASTSHSRGITLRRCTFLNSGTVVCINYLGIANTPADWTVDRCTILSLGSCLSIQGGDPGVATDLDMNITIQNCGLFSTASSGVVIAGASTATAGGKPGGVRLRNCTILTNTGFRTTGANNSTTIPAEVYNCVILSSTALNAAATSQIANDYCLLVGGLTNASAGANSKTGTATAPLLHVGQEVQGGRATRAFLTPMAGSPLLGFGNGGTSPSPPTVDFLNRPRPAGGGSASAGIGYLERHDTIVPGGAANADGASGDCWKQAGPSDDEFQVAVDAIATSIAVKQKTSGYVGTNYPRVSLLANAEIGVAAQDVTDSAANTSYTTLTVGPFTPTAKGVVTLRIQNRTGDGSGVVYWDTVAVT
jgi:hypothetical protein